MSSAKGRAVQLNAGAACAASPLLAFVHADTRPPRDLVNQVRQREGHVD